MIWYFFGTIYFAVLSTGKPYYQLQYFGNKGVDPIFLSRLNFNDEVRREYFYKK
jgi:hypothetical protein